MSRIVIGDVHGCYKTMMALIAQLPPGIPITFAGDLVDRGGDSNKVIKFIRDNGHDCVKGNHEQLMIEELWFDMRFEGQEHPYAGGLDWHRNGGDATIYSYLDEELNSFGETVKTKTYDIKTMKEDVEWLKTLPLFLEYKDLVDSKGQHLLVTHSTAADVWGQIDPSNPRFAAFVLWSRKDVPSKIKGIFNCYGHTPQKKKALVRSHFACIDTGACFKRADYGKMTALQFPEMKVFIQKNIEDDV